MNSDLLIRPVELGLNRIVVRIFRMLKGTLNMALAEVSSNDFLVAPVVPGGDQQFFAKNFFCNLLIRTGVQLPFDVESAAAFFMDKDFDQLRGPFSFQDLLDFVLHVFFSLFVGTGKVASKIL